MHLVQARKQAATLLSRTEPAYTSAACLKAQMTPRFTCLALMLQHTSAQHGCAMSNLADAHIAAQMQTTAAS